MGFSKFKNLGEAIQQFKITYQEASFMVEREVNIPKFVREDIQFMLQEGVVDNSEFAICENLIYPVIKEVWKNYHDRFMLWSHQALNYDEYLSGFPEYILAKRSPLGKVVFDRPYFAIVEAKQDKFEEGWAQCIAELVAAQKLNENLEIVLFGIVSNGKQWQFAKLSNDRFTRHPLPYSIYELERLFAAVNYIFDECRQQLDRIEVA